MIRNALLTLITLVGIAPPTAAICRASPDGEHPCELFWTYATVFDGTVKRIVQHEGDPTASWEIMRRQHRTVTFDVHRSWWGQVGREAQLVLPGGSTLIYSESFGVQVGKRYLIYARSFQPGGPLSTTGCDPSSPIDSKTSKSNLGFLTKLSQPSRGARFYGTIDGRLLEEKAGKPRREYQLVLEGNKTRRQIRSVKGAFDFGRLSPGTYRFSIKVPEWPNGRGAPTTITLPHPHACLRQDIVLADK
jgi:hypothetical protein